MTGAGRRHLDAVILPRLPKGRAHWRDINVEDEDVIVVQAKAHRLGMYLMGQAIFSAELLRPFKPKSIRSVILCRKDDSVLHPLLAAYAEVEVVVDTGVPTLPTEGEVGT